MAKPRAKRRPAEPPCPHGFKWAECCHECSPPGALRRDGQRLRAEWRDDPAFVNAAAELWPEDVAAASAGGYDRGAAQKLSYRYQGWRARLEDLG